MNIFNAANPLNAPSNDDAPSDDDPTSDDEEDLSSMSDSGASLKEDGFAGPKILITDANIQTVRAIKITLIKGCIPKYESSKLIEKTYGDKLYK